MCNNKLGNATENESDKERNGKVHPQTIAARHTARSTKGTGSQGRLQPFVNLIRTGYSQSITTFLPNTSTSTK